MPIGARPEIRARGCTIAIGDRGHSTSHVRAVKCRTDAPLLRARALAIPARADSGRVGHLSEETTRANLRLTVCKAESGRHRWIAERTDRHSGRTASNAGPSGRD